MSRYVSDPWLGSFRQHYSRSRRSLDPHPLIPAQAGIQWPLAPSPPFAALGPRFRGDERTQNTDSTWSKPALTSPAGHDHGDPARLLVLGGGRAREYEQLFRRCDAAGGILGIGAEAGPGRVNGIVFACRPPPG